MKHNTKNVPKIKRINCPPISKRQFGSLKAGDILRFTKRNTSWVKPYMGPFEKEEAEGLVNNLKEIANPDVNLICDAKIRERKNKKGWYDIYIKKVRTQHD